VVGRVWLVGVLGRVQLLVGKMEESDRGRRECRKSIKRALIETLRQDFQSNSLPTHHHHFLWPKKPSVARLGLSLILIITRLIVSLPLSQTTQAHQNIKFNSLQPTSSASSGIKAQAPDSRACKYLEH